MKNSTKIALIVVCFLLVLFLISILIWGIVNKDFSFYEPLKIVKEESYLADSIHEITIQTRSSDITFFRTNDDKIKVVEKSFKKTKQKDLFKTKNSNGVLQIEPKNQSNFCIGFCFFQKSLYEIYVPNTYRDSITIKTASGDVVLNSLEEQLEKLTIVTTSGDIQIKSNLKASLLKLKSTSGDIDTMFLEVPSIEMETVSGDIESGTVKGEKIYMKTISGDIENEWLQGAIEISTISGEIDINYLDVTGKSKMTSTSGDIGIMINQKSNCRINATSVSGDIHFPNFEVIKESHPFDLKTVSGDIDIQVAP